jgi:aryl-alcohol dehydrogenase-like predicted oxidoreductase
MQQDFLRAPLGKLGTLVCRLGLSATYRPGRATIHKALDEGINYLLFFGIDNQMIRVVRETIQSHRDQYVLATGGYNYVWGHQNLRHALERRLRQARTDYIDVFHFFGVTRRKHFTPRVREELQAVRESGLVRAVSISTHDPGLALDLVRDDALDAIMIRYNAALREAESKVFPNLPASNPAVVSYTATRWAELIRRPRGYSESLPAPTAGMCYRFVLANPAVHVCMMAPSNLKQFQENLAEIRRGPLDDTEMRFMREFGDIVNRK